MTELSRESLKELLDYNPDTGIFKWRIDVARNIFSGQIAGSKNNQGYIIIGIKGKRFGAHRLAWLYVYGNFPDIIDHIDQVRDNNRISNLREADYSLSNQNRTIYNPLGYIGIRFRNDFFEANIRINGRITRIGKYDTAEEASQAYQEALREYIDARTIEYEDSEGQN